MTISQSSVRTVSVLVLGLALTLVVSGASVRADGGRGHSTPGFVFGEPGTPSEVDRSVRIEAADMEFKPASVVVRAGETVRLVVVNTDDVVHEFTIGPPEVQREHRREMMELWNEGVLDPVEGMPHGRRHGDANAVMVNPGETAEVIWTFARPERLEFGCNIPGHYESGMRGEFVLR